ncbi:hypothetical protein [Kutzneria albida]|uniref:Uncharacterized protein n=1 Tax=Kutzneria albida DSM 43870 TaxID=1449976 RepID=W5WAX1_9PSEU|nr:hypothetical protein [Kutzneria albida]AHH98278.1 hypothetical protein KALB_4916 [Kutzneria albida DSM 43870]
MSKAERDWNGLNLRQQVYLRAIYRAEMVHERRELDRAHTDRRMFPQHRPRDEWAWLVFAMSAQADYHQAMIHNEVKAAGELDQGAGSTLKALADRGLIEVEGGHGRGRRGTVVEQILVKLTTAGRAAARVDNPARVKPPKGLLSEWLWEKLAAIAVAEPDGLDVDKAGGWTWPHHLGPERKGLIEVRTHVEQAPPGHWLWKAIEEGRMPPESVMFKRRRWHLTAAGREHIVQHLNTYRAIFPDVIVSE